MCGKQITIVRVENEEMSTADTTICVGNEQLSTAELLSAEHTNNYETIQAGSHSFNHGTRNQDMDMSRLDNRQPVIIDNQDDDPVR